MKKKISSVFHLLGLSWVFFKISLWFYGKNHIRLLNYHDTDLSSQKFFEQQLHFYSKYYVGANYDDLQSFFEKGVWSNKKPGLIICFDDGLRSNYDHALPLLQKYGFYGWFCVPPGFVDCDISEQVEFARNQRIFYKDFYSDGRVAMNWGEVKNLHESGHVIVNHTMDHHRMQNDDTQSTLDKQINQSSFMFKERVNIQPEVFCWVGGETRHYHKDAFQYIKFKHKFGFMTNTSPALPSTNPYFINRTNIETHYPMHLVLFQLSGIMDLLYHRKRKLVKQKLI